MRYPRNTAIAKNPTDGNMAIKSVSITKFMLDFTGYAKSLINQDNVTKKNAPADNIKIMPSKIRSYEDNPKKLRIYDSAPARLYIPKTTERTNPHRRPIPRAIQRVSIYYKSTLKMDWF